MKEELVALLDRLERLGREIIAAAEGEPAEILRLAAEKRVLAEELRRDWPELSETGEMGRRLRRLRRLDAEGIELLRRRFARTQDRLLELQAGLGRYLSRRRARGENAGARFLDKRL